MIEEMTKFCATAFITYTLFNHLLFEWRNQNNIILWIYKRNTVNKHKSYVNTPINIVSLSFQQIKCVKMQEKKIKFECLEPYLNEEKQFVLKVIKVVWARRRRRLLSQSVSTPIKKLGRLFLAPSHRHSNEMYAINCENKLLSFSV